MSGYVVEASVAIKWFIQEIHFEVAVQAKSLRQWLHVPAFLTLEIGNVRLRRFGETNSPERTARRF